MSPATPPPTDSQLAAFLRHLFGEGIADIGDVPEVAQGCGVDEELSARALALGRTLAAGSPTADLKVSRWAAERFYFATFAYINRELGEAEVRAGLSLAVPVGGEGDPDFGADLVFSFVGDLVKMVRATASGDPLVEALAELVRPWPLSSVGIAEACPAPGETLRFWGQPALRMLYVDRVIASGDIARLADPRVREAVAAAMGAHGELAPKFAREIDRQAADHEGRTHD